MVIRIFFVLLLWEFVGSPILYAQIPDSLAKYSIAELDALFQKNKAISNFEPMLAYAEAAVEKSRNSLGEEDTLYARMLYNLAYYQDYKAEKFDLALEYYSKASEIQKQKIPNHIYYTNTLLAIADLYNHTYADYEKAEELYLETKSICEKSSNISHLEYALTISHLADLYTTLGSFKKAEELYLEANDLTSKLKGNQPEYLEPLIGVLSIYYNLGKYDKALECSKEVIRKLPQEHDYYPIVLNYLGNIYKRQQDYDRAEAVYLEINESYRKKLGEEHLYFAYSLNNLAVLYYEMGEYEQTEQLYLQVIGIFEKQGQNQHPLYAATINNLASLYFSQEKYEKAKKKFHQSIKLREAIFGPEHLEYALTLQNAATNDVRIGDYEEAKAEYELAKSIFAKTIGTMHETYAANLRNLAQVYKLQDNFGTAAKLYLEAKSIYENTFGKEHPEYIKSMNYLLELAIKEKDWKKAWDYGRSALEINCKRNLNTAIDANWYETLKASEFLSLEYAIVTLEGYYHLLKLENKKTAQLYVSNLAIELLKRNKNKLVGEQDKLRLLKENHKWTLKSLCILEEENKIEEAFACAEQNKSVLLLEAAQKNKAYTFGNLPDSIIEQEKVFQEQKGALNAQLLEKRSSTEKDSLRAILNKLNIKIKGIKATIEKNYPKYNHLKYEERVIKIKEVQDLLDEKEALIEYVVGDSVVYIFYLDKSSVTLIEQPLKYTALNKQINKLHKALSDYNWAINKTEKSYDRYTSAAYWFYQQLLKPVLADAKGIEQLIIVTDGELGHLPFEAFLTKAVNQGGSDFSQLPYLLLDYGISYNYSGTLWRDNVKDNSKQINGNILAIAADYSVLPDSVAMLNRLPTNRKKRALLGELPGAKKEVEKLMKVFNGDFLFGENSTEKIFKEKANEFGIIHLAMHGLLDARNPTLSSLAFTENGDSIENNFLQAYEVSKMNLNAKLVVLSACETGYGKFEQGNGIASLARSFMYAGVPSILVSLWPVNDDATAVIMQQFYENLSEGMDKSVALQDAKLSYIKRVKGVLAHPVFWSPFIQIGNSEAIFIKKRRDWKKGAIVGGLLLLVLVGFVVRRLKKKERG